MSDDSKPVEAEPSKIETTTKKDATEEVAIAKEGESAGAENETVKSKDPGADTKEDKQDKDNRSGRGSRSRSRSPPRRRRDDRSRSPRRFNDRRDDRRNGDRKYNNHRNNKPANIKSKYTDLPETDDPDEIRKQVEFYFSDSNLTSDLYMFTQTGGPENKSVPIKTLHGFKRMRHFQPFSAVVAALKDSKVLDVVENDTEVKRKVPIALDKEVTFEQSAKVFQDRAMSQSIYAKGFGEETDRTQLDIEEFFQPFGPINSVRLRRTNHDKTFKGSVFVEFESPEVMQAFMDSETKPQWNDNDLEFKTKKQYCDGKVDDINAGKIRPNEGNFERRDNDRGNFRDRGRNGRGRGRGRGRGNFNDRRDRDRDGGDDWKSRRDDFQRNGRRRRSPSYEPAKQEVDARGVPVVRASSPSPARKSSNGAKEGNSPKPSTDAAKTEGSPNGKKRSREGDAEADQSEAKKAKADE